MNGVVLILKAAKLATFSLISSLNRYSFAYHP